ncbi:hypothetical protein P8C59_005806 [Phyllachora maydis]|uniref:Uncharacterized protein n=1 Tax=Phyllachora maydis TaxID=1825666 RepID=A0AAD9I6V6_9PEZI|nr:hypothetical protein P8C59_005806 [Phyllachora maydis]
MQLLRPLLLLHHHRPAVLLFSLLLATQLAGPGLAAGPVAARASGSAAGVSRCKDHDNAVAPLVMTAAGGFGFNYSVPTNGSAMAMHNDMAIILIKNNGPSSVTCTCAGKDGLQTVLAGGQQAVIGPPQAQLSAMCVNGSASGGTKGTVKGRKFKWEPRAVGKEIFHV